MAEPKNVSLHLDRLQNILALGVRRASSFMALGLRVSADESVTDLTLDSNFQIFFMPQELPIEKVREAQRNFGTWIIGNGLRELDQAASLYTDELFKICTLAQFHNKNYDTSADKHIDDFRARTNVANKLTTIADQFGVSDPLRLHTVGLTKLAMP